MKRGMHDDRGQDILKHDLEAMSLDSCIGREEFSKDPV